MHKNSVLLCTYSTDLYKCKYFFISLSYHFIIRCLVFCVGALNVEAEDRSVFPSALPASPTEIPVTPSSEHDPDNTSYIANESNSVLNATESTDTSDNGGGQSIEGSDNEKTDQSQELYLNIEKDGAIKSERKNPNGNQDDEGEESHPNGDQYDTDKGINLNVDQYDTDKGIDLNVDQDDNDEGIDLNVDQYDTDEGIDETVDQDDKDTDKGIDLNVDQYDTDKEIDLNVDQDDNDEGIDLNVDQYDTDEGIDETVDQDDKDTDEGIDENVDQDDNDEGIDLNVDQYDKNEGIDLNEHKILLANKDLDAATEDMQTKGQ